jgi:hypothetical protein
MIRIISLLTSLLISCAAPNRQIQMNVSSLALATAQRPGHYMALPGNPGINKNDLQFKEFSSYIQAALNTRGFNLTQDLSKLELIIFVSYGVGAPENHLSTYNIPVWGRNGISSSTVQGNTITHKPTYGVTGYVSNTTSTRTYSRYLIVEALDYRHFTSTGEVASIWKTTIESRGTTEDLRVVIPFLVNGAQRYFGVDTKKAIPITLDFHTTK